MSKLKAWWQKKWQQLNCDHHWHWSQEQKSLCGDVVCCRCDKEEELGAVVGTDGTDPIAEGLAMECRIDWPFPWLLACPKCEGPAAIHQPPSNTSFFAPLPAAYMIKCQRCHHYTRLYTECDAKNPFMAAVDEWQTMDRTEGATAP